MTITENQMEATDTWEEQFVPIHNHIDTNASWGGLMFETYGEEFDFVRTQPRNHVWTWVDGDGGTYIISGLELINRIGYFVTKHPWVNFVEVQVESYSEEDGE